VTGQPGHAVTGQRQRLAAQQEALVAALVAGAPPPPGFDAVRLDAARTALLRKRAGEVRRTWPALAAQLGPQWTDAFAGWADGRPTHGALRDGFDFARALARTGDLPQLAVGELAAQEGYWHYDGETAPQPRRLPGPARRWLGHRRVRRLGMMG
jgi:hypothetical protein